MSGSLPRPGSRSTGPAFFRCRPALELDQPVLLNVLGAGSDAAVFNHLVIDIGANARATIVLQHAARQSAPGT